MNSRYKNFITLYLLCLLFTGCLVAIGYMAYTLGVLFTITAVCMVGFTLFAYNVLMRINKYRYL